ncbi:MAG: ABC transporter ATP-binding protein [Candidatus Omnitrophica bacterium]|nr:ABC transporter ATP-binding protein [Candidatus Omnitrophota bacterium]
MPILKVDIKSKSFLVDRVNLVVLENINFQIEKGEFLCVIGPSGCGKTTLLNIIAGLDLSYEGYVLHQEQLIKGSDAHRLLIFQEMGLFPWLTVKENIEFGLKLKRMDKKEIENISSKYLEMVNLAKFKNSFIHELSGGMKQRVALARALAMNPDILLMDEPFSSLDAQARDILHSELQKIWAVTKKTIIFITHNVREAVCLGDRILVLSSAPGARVKATFSVNLPRPRQIESDGVIENVKLIKKVLDSEIEKYYGMQFNK